MAMTICPKCSTSNRAGAKFCRNCGQNLTPTPAPTVLEPTPSRPPTPTPNIAPAPENFCPHCGHANAPGVQICTLCNQPMTSFAHPPAYDQKPTGISRQKWIAIGLGAAVALVCLIIGLFVAFGGSDDEAEATFTPTETESSILDGELPGLDDIETIIPDLEEIETIIPEIDVLETLIPEDLSLDSLGFDFEIDPITDEEEIKIGLEAAEEWESDYSISRDPALNDRVNSIGQRILPHQPRKNIPFTFKVMDTNEINAYALPGGFIYVTRGLIQDVRSDDELAGVIAHEIAHISMRHSAEQLEASAVAVAAMDVFFSDEDSETIYDDQSAEIAADFIAQIAFSGWGREQELEADEHGTIYMHAAGYYVQAVLDLFHRWAAEESGGSNDPLEDLLATHPPFEDRIEHVEEVIRENNLQ